MSFYKSLNRVYNYTQTTELMYIDYSIAVVRNNRDNRPMNNRLVKIHKGVDNTLRFNVNDPDRKPVDTGNLMVKAVLISDENKEKVLEKYLQALGSPGQMILSIQQGDIQDVAPGFYSLVITGEQPLTSSTIGEYYGSPFYTDLESNIIVKAEITDDADPTPIPTSTIGLDDWTDMSAQGNPPMIQFYSSAFPGNRVRNHINALHTIAIFTSNYSGKITVYGTLEENPDTDIFRNWTPIEISPGVTVLTLNNSSETQYFNFYGNYMWIKFQRLDATNNLGTIDQIQLRS